MKLNAASNLTRALLVGASLFSSPAFARPIQSSDVQKTVSSASASLDTVMADAKSTIPPAILSAAQCVVDMQVIKAAYGWGGAKGTGLASCREADGSWGTPLFVTLASASVGPQIGFEITQLALVFLEPNARDVLITPGFTLSASSGVAVGPEGSDAKPDPNTRIYTYSKSSGLYAGLDIEGSSLSPEADYNAFVYGGQSYADVLNTPAAGAPASVTPYLGTLAKY